MICLPPDKFNRFFVASQYIRSLNTLDHKHTYVLDLGSNENLLSSFLDGCYVVQGDIEYNSRPENFVQLRAEAIPFADKSFDVVVCLDVLEHVHESHRETILNEIFRVASHTVIIAFPIDHRHVVQSEILFARIWQKIYHSPHVFLEEHRRFGLIKPSLIQEFMHTQFPCTQQLNTFSWQLWLLSQLTSQILGFLPDTELIRDTFFMLMNSVSSQIQNESDAYRAFIVGSHENIPNISTLFPVSPSTNVIPHGVAESFSSVHSTLNNLHGYCKELESKLKQTTLELERTLHCSKTTRQKYEALLSESESADKAAIENNYRTLEKYAIHLETVLSAKDRMIIDLQKQLTDLMTGNH